MLGAGRCRRLAAVVLVLIDLMVLRNRDYLLVVKGEETVGVIDAARVYDAILKGIAGCAAKCQPALAQD